MMKVKQMLLILQGFLGKCHYGIFEIVFIKIIMTDIGMDKGTTLKPSVSSE